jgi:hypothetical protein
MIGRFYGNTRLPKTGLWCFTVQATCLYIRDDRLQDCRVIILRRLLDRLEGLDDRVANLDQKIDKLDQRIAKQENATEPQGQTSKTEG